MNDISLQHTGLQSYIETHEKFVVSAKLGGDNMSLMLANARVAEILQTHGVTQSFSVSAFRSSKQDFNTTGKLISAGESQDLSRITEILGEISDFHSELLEEILKNSPTKLRNTLINYARKLFAEYTNQLQKTDSLERCSKTFDYQVGKTNSPFSLLSIGEIIAAKVFVRFLRECGIPAVYVDTASLENISADTLDGKLVQYLQKKFQEIFSQNPQSIPIIPGYIGGIRGGILKKLGRGYTDYTGERSTVALHNLEIFYEVVFYIQKLYGFKSTDPRALSENQNAKSLNHLSYDLVERAISRKGAGAGLINEFALSRDIREKSIDILVGNPTDMSDIAIIDTDGDRTSSGVTLVLGRDYVSKQDNTRYGRKCYENSQEHIIYLMGEHIGNLRNVFEEACNVLTQNNIEHIAGQLSMLKKSEISLVFQTRQEAIAAQGVLHKYFIEENIG